MCLCSLDFLLNRPQIVKIGGNSSSSLTLSTGRPQGCVLSPMLYSLFTYDCVSCHESSQILTFADDTTLLGLITNSDESEYRDQVKNLISWCSENNLELNANKTKEMIVDFRRTKSSPLSSGRTVKIVQHFKFLDSTISNDLKCELHNDTIVKKEQQWLYFLRRLRSFGLTPQIMLTFYRAAIESELTFSITVWFGCITVKEMLRLNRVVKTASRITVKDLTSLESLYQQRLLGRVILISHDSFHSARDLFDPFHLVAGSDPSTPGPTGLVASFLPYRRAANPQKEHYVRGLKLPPHTQMLYHWKVLHLHVSIRPVVELPNDAVSVNPRSNKVTVKR
ncbi:hypothetical protein NP493_358g05019 [Ridgeia piscesae]|uniref:Reverse transcriptase domain-containing protein n=1 Tax=Ridgeia piscesae TaxID=27915 RepID=A0AAD9NVF2_RIDPI|nr:hypothetical protein NP493_358g05019 [Ridgeia piscesae]